MQDPGGGPQVDPTQAGQTPPPDPTKVDPTKVDPTKVDPTQVDPTKTADLPPVAAPDQAVPGEAIPERALFGYDYFAQARKAIDARAAALAQSGAKADAFDQLVGVNVSATTPERYQLGTGDQLVVRVWSDVREPENFELRVDERGGVFVPVSGDRLVVRGMTLSQVERTLRERLAEVVRDAKVSVTLGELRTVSVTVAGESYAPGNYQVPSVATLFNLLYGTGGPSDNGTLRSIQLKRSNGSTRVFDFYSFLLRGDASADIPLQPGDVLFIPPVQARVRVRGEVFRPATYEIKQGETLRTVLGFAGGVKPSGVAQRVSLESIRPGMERRLVDVDLTQKTPAQDPPLFDGDVVEVTSIRPVLKNAVVLEGEVDQPGQYEVTAGLTFADLIERARGLLPNAGPRADVIRLLPDGTTRLIRVDVGRALLRDPGENVVLEPNDRVRIYDVANFQWMGGRVVHIEGAVRNPGNLTRAEGMRVTDAILQAGGLLPNASLDLAFVQRENPDGTPGPLVRIDLRKAFAQDPTQNVVLQDGDSLRIFTVQDATPLPTESVEVIGAVQRPGTYRRGQNMTVRELLEQAGQPLPNASVEKAYLQRTNPDGTVGPIFVVDLRRALAGDPEANLTLMPGDRLSVYSVDQAGYTGMRTVRITGAVQRPDTYAAAANMTLEQLIGLAGGLQPNSSNHAEIGSAWKPAGTPPTRVEFSGDIGNYRIPNVNIEPGDIVTIPSRGDILAQPAVVTIVGAVAQPGTYLITSPTLRLSELVKRAGGLRDNAFPQGIEYIRSPEYLSTEVQRRIAPRVAEVLKEVAADQYKQAAAMLNIDRLRAVFSNGGSVTTGGAPAANVDQPVETGSALDKALAQILTEEGVTPARPLTDRELLPAGNMSVRMDRALARPRSRDDVIVMDGDVIMVPIRPTTVNITGAVFSPSSVQFEAGKSLDYYLQRAGGATADADSKSILIIRATGELVRDKRGVRIELGDTILVPTKVQAVRISDSKNTLTGALQTVTSAATTLAIIRAITK